MSETWKPTLFETPTHYHVHLIRGKYDGFGQGWAKDASTEEVAKALENLANDVRQVDSWYANGSAQKQIAEYEAWRATQKERPEGT